MLANIVGNVDSNAAAVLIVFWIAAAAAIVAFIVNYRSKQRLQLQHSIDSQKLSNEDAANKRQSEQSTSIKFAQIASEKEIQFRRIDTGLIELKRNEGAEQ